MSRSDVRLTKKEQIEYLNIIYFYRKHPVLAARDLLGVSLAPHQRLVLKSIWSKPNVALVLSRGMSKTFINALAALLYSLLYHGMKVLCLSGQTFRQGQLILEEAEGILLASNKFVKNVPFGKVAFGDFVGGRWRVVTRSQDSWSMQVGKDGSTIKTFPMSNPEKIRGYRAHIVFLDERNAIDKEMIEKVIKPFANVKRNVLEDFAQNGSSEDFENTFIHSGTIEYTWQSFARLIQDILKSRDDNSIVVEFNYEDAYKYGINMEQIEKQRDADGVDFGLWAAENKNQLREDVGTYYGGKLILQKAVFKKICVNKEKDIWESYMPYRFKEKKMPCFMGIDPARESDNFAVTILALDKPNKRIYPVFQYNWKKTMFQDIANYIFKLVFDRYNIKRIGVDCGGGGFMLQDLLLRPTNKAYPPIYDPSDEERKKLMGNVEGKSLLRMLKPNQERNTIWNTNIKEAMQSGEFLFTDYMFVPRQQDKETEIILKAMVECKRQFVMIKSKIGSTSSNMSFYAESGKKDLYSSTLYAMAVLREYEEEAIKRLYDDGTEYAIGGWLNERW